jgi:hypothetical protein
VLDPQTGYSFAFSWSLKSFNDLNPLARCLLECL